MSRLIDAEALIKAINPMYISKVNIVADTFTEGCMQFEKLIKEQPTAYDIDKVVGHLDICSANHFLKGNHYDEGVRDAYYYAIDIVMKGGAE